MENKEEKKLLTVKDLCAYLSIGDTKARELLHNPDNGFTVRIGNRLYAHRDKVGPMSRFSTCLLYTSPSPRD